MDNIIVENLDGLFEFLNDAIFETIILHAYNDIKDPYFKQFIGNFLLTISDIYIYEFTQFNFIDKSNITDSNNRLLIDLRKNAMKYSFTSHSNHFTKKASDMGLSYDNNNINDCVIYYDKQKNYLDNNFRMWPYYKENLESKKFFYDLVYNCDLWMRGLLRNEKFDFYSELMKSIEPFETSLLKELNRNKVKVVSYSANRLFSSARFEDNQKGFVLNYYGIIKSILYFEKSFNTKNISISLGNVSFESKRFFCKLKAICIENIFINFKNENSDIWNNFSCNINNCIPEKFWKLNRLCRRNIHYKDCTKINDEDIIFIEKYQNIYLDKFCFMVDHQLDFNVTLFDIINTTRAKLHSYDN